MNRTETQNLVNALKKDVVTVIFKKINTEEIRIMPCTLNEEILAWNYGKTIAKSLDIYIDNVIYENCMTDAIMSYIKSGLNKVYGKNINADIIKTYYV